MKKEQEERERKEGEKREEMRVSLIKGPLQVSLPYLKEVLGRHLGMYINQIDRGDMTHAKNPTPMCIQDARLIPETPTLTTNGFQLVHRPTKCADLCDNDAVILQYYPEV